MKSCVWKLFIRCSILVAFVGLAGCGGYYAGEIAGYIKDAESNAGINGAIIRIYSEQPESAAQDGFIV